MFLQTRLVWVLHVRSLLLGRDAQVRSSSALVAHENKTTRTATIASVKARNHVSPSRISRLARCQHKLNQLRTTTKRPNPNRHQRRRPQRVSWCVGKVVMPQREDDDTCVRVKSFLWVPFSCIWLDGAGGGWWVFGVAAPSPPGSGHHRLEPPSGRSVAVHFVVCISLSGR